MKLRVTAALKIAALALLATGWSSLATAQPPIRHRIDIPQQELSAALSALAKQTRIQFIYPAELVTGYTAQTLKGNMTAEKALTELLTPAQLRYEFLDARTVTLTPVDELAIGSASRSPSMALPPEEAASMRMSQAQSASPAAASPTTSDGARPGAAAQNDPQVQEIIVTATKRAQPLQDIPLSVTVIDENQLIKQGAVHFIDYATRVPNLSFGATGDDALSLNSMQIRGVAGADTTGFYIDEVPIPENMSPKVIDISRIEVLRGPQGSLYGARSMGGTMRLITKRADPTQREFKAHVALGTVAEGDMDYSADASFNVPIAANAAFRGNAYYLQESGLHDIVVDNPTIVGDETRHENADKGEYWGVQAMITWNVSDNFTVEPRFMYQKSHLDWVPYSDLRPDNFVSTRVIDLADPNDQDWSISSLTLSWDTAWGRITSATGFFQRDQIAREEYSDLMNWFSGVLGGDPNYYPPGGSLLSRMNNTRQISEEIRFTSDFDGRLQVTGGVFYSDQDQSSLAPCSFSVGISEASGFPFGTDCMFYGDGDTEIEEIALFGEFEFALRENLALTLGGRYFENTLFNSLFITGAFIDFGAPPGPQRTGEQKENGFNPKVALKWDVSEDWALYSSAAKGFRIGGTNVFPVPPELCGDQLAALGISGSPDTYDSDSLWSYEIGSKSTYANNRFSLNLAAFFIDWEDIIQPTILPCGVGFTNNTGKAESMGFEIELAGRPTASLSYSFGVGYTDAQITDPEDAAGVFRGDPLPQVPEWNFSGDTEYRFPIGAYEGYVFLSYRWVDESVSFTSSRSNPRLRDAYGLLDARLGMTVGGWEISLLGRNLTNEHANLSDNLSLVIEDPRRPRYVINRPRTIGLDLRWAF